MSSYWTPDSPPDNKHAIWNLYRRQRWSRVLELGPYDGRDTINLSRHTDRLSTLEGRPKNLHTVRQVCEASQVYNVSYYVGNLEKYDFARIGRFDCVWCVGLLYHLPNPWILVEKLASVTSTVFGWSHVAEKIDGDRNGYRGRPYKEGGLEDGLSGLSEDSWWLWPDDFARLWMDNGFSRFAWLTPPQTPHPNGGHAAQFVARQ